jgi:hypothetical protein
MAHRCSLVALPRGEGASGPRVNRHAVRDSPVRLGRSGHVPILDARVENDIKQVDDAVEHHAGEAHEQDGPQDHGVVPLVDGPQRQPANPRQAEDLLDDQQAPREIPQLQPDHCADGMEVAAASAAVPLQSLEVRSPEDFDCAFEAAASAGVTNIIVFSSPMVFLHRTRIAELAATHGLPAISPFREFAEAGGLMASGQNLSDLFRRCGRQVGRNLQGSHRRPGSLGRRWVIPLVAEVVKGLEAVVDS